jgi:hypothetical protein
MLVGLALEDVIMARGLSSFVFATLLMMLFTALLFGLLNNLHIQAGSMVDWMIGIAIAFWLLTITTVPWNVYFEALSVEDEATMSKQIGITVDDSKSKYVRKLKIISLTIAIGLHLVSSAVLFYLSAAHITPIGFYGGIASALLTLLRPSVRAYEYLWQRLRDIRLSIKYPREDVVSLRQRVDGMERTLLSVSEQLNPNNSLSIPADLRRNISVIKSEVEMLADSYTCLAQDNREEHEKLRREAQSAVAKLSSDSQFLDHVREIVRMIKSA